MGREQISDHDAPFRHSSCILYHALFVNLMLSVEFLHEQERKEKKEDFFPRLRHVEK